MISSWDVPPAGYEHVTPKEYKAMQASGQIPHSVVNPSSQILQGTKYAHPDPLEAAKAAAAIITATILGNQNKTGPALTRQARRLYVGNIPFNISENELIEFFQTNLISSEASGAPSVITCQINVDKNFAFVEFRTIEDTTNAMALDGISCKGQPLKIRRPHDYQKTGTQRPNNNQTQHPNKPESGGRPASGALATGANATSLLGAQSNQSAPVIIQVPGMQGITPNSTPRVLTEVLCLINMVVPDELKDDDEYFDILEDIRDECSKYGTVKSIQIPRPPKETKRPRKGSHDDYDDDNDDDNGDANRNDNGDDQQQQTVPGLGRVFVEFDSATEAQRAQINLAGRRFAGRVVVISYFDRDKYRNREF